MTELKDFLDKFERLKQRKLIVQTEKTMLEEAKAEALAQLPPDVTAQNLEEYIQRLEKELQDEIAQLEIPKGVLDDLTNMARGV